MSKFTQKQIQQVWEKGDVIPGKDPDRYRIDAYGNEIFRNSYGKDSPMGWQVDHKHPVSKGGSDQIRNLQPLQSAENKRKGNKYPY